MDELLTLEYVDTMTDLNDALAQADNLRSVGYNPVVLTLDVPSDDRTSELHVLALSTITD